MVKMKCPKCQFENPPIVKYCIECHYNISESEASVCLKKNNQEAFIYERPTEENMTKMVPTAGERKHVTVLFSDLSGYTEMCDKLDPEVAKEIMGHIFEKIAVIVSSYDGFIEKFIGDAVMAVFGVPKVHEDDSLRAIKAAIKIHELVKSVSPKIEQKIGRQLSMHTGINTGLVVIGHIDLEKGTHGILGDTVNLAARLSGLAKSGDILIGPNKFRRVSGYFNLESMGQIEIKGKSKAINVYKVLSYKKAPDKIHRLQGVKADLIGRTLEMAELHQALENLGKGEGSIIVIRGDAGIGKSRIVKEFMTSLTLDSAVKWFEGHSYSFSQNIPYFPLIDFFNRALQIEENDSSEAVRDKIRSGIGNLLGSKNNYIPFIERLYSQTCPELDRLSPEQWKFQLQNTFLEIVSALAKKALSVFCFEDLHWADPSFIELIRKTFLQMREPAIIICTYRSGFIFFNDHELQSISKIYREIHLHNLPAPETVKMIESLLQTNAVPVELLRFAEKKAEGNPFYLEEIINSFVESEILIQRSGRWEIKKALDKAELSTSIHSIISDRLDRLERKTKRVLQEASVIGPTFLYLVLIQITDLKNSIKPSLNKLESFDLIRTKTAHPYLQYNFKHVLTQEVAYQTLLKKECQAIHERIGLVMEDLFKDRLADFSETLAYQFKRGISINKAIKYLIMSGKKCLEKYSLNEAHIYFREAFDILQERSKNTIRERRVLVDLLLEWSLVFHWRGAYKELIELLVSQIELAESIEDKPKLAKFYAYLGTAFGGIEELNYSYKSLLKALKLGEESKNESITGYACARLARTCAELGQLDDAISHGNRARYIAMRNRSDQELYLASCVGLGIAWYFKGYCSQTEEVGRDLLKYGRNRSEKRLTAQGFQILGWSRQAAGDFPSAIKYYQKAIATSVDPMISFTAKLLLGISYISTEQLEEAEKTLDEVVVFGENYGLFGPTSRIAHAILEMAKGNLRKSVNIAENLRNNFFHSNRKSRYVAAENLLGQFYLKIFFGGKERRLSSLLRNFGFFVKNFPVAFIKAKKHFNMAIKVSEEIGAKSYLGQAYMGMGCLYKAKRDNENAQKYFVQATKIFEDCDAYAFLKQVKKEKECLK